MHTPAEDECFSHVPHEFLICTTIHKARQLGIFTGQMYVRTILDKVQRNTKAFANSENPYFNEYFVFELKCTLTELLRLTIIYELRRHTSCKKNNVHGELLIDLQSVWNQPNRCYFKKWGRLEIPIGTKIVSGGGVGGGDGSVLGDQNRGFLQIDLAIVSQATNPDSLMRPYEANDLSMNKWQINQDYEDIEKNLLQNLDPSVQCNIMYDVSIYRGFFMKKGDYFIQFRFNPFKGKTMVRKGTTLPIWNEAVSFAWTFPSVAQTLVLQVMFHEHLQWKCLTEYELHFDDIAFKDKPSLGPAYLHMYDPQNSLSYIGRLLIELRSECVKSNARREVNNRVISPIDEQRWWKETTFHIEFIVMQGDFIHGNVSNCKLSLRLAEYTSNTVECYLKAYPGKQKRTSSLKYFRQEAPYKAIVMRCLQPDNRHKFESDFFMQDILDYIKTEIETFKLFQLKYTNYFQVQIKCFKAIILAIQNKIREGILDRRLEYAGFQDPTTWDTNRLVYLQEFFTKFPEELRNLRQKLKSSHTHHIEHTIEEVLQDLVRYSNELANLLASTRVQDEWPDLLIVLSVPGNKELGVCRLNAKYYLSPPPGKESASRGLCWQVRNFVFKDIHCQHTCVHCGCTVAVVNGCLGIIEESERSDYLGKRLFSEWRQTETIYWTPTTAFSVFRCRVYIHQAKVRPGSDRTGLCDAFIRVIFCSHSAETPIESATLSPIWNLVLSFDTIVLSGSVTWYAHNPPLLAIELYDIDKHTSDDYLGCGMMAVSLPLTSKDESNVDGEPMSARNEMVKTRNAFQKFQQLKSLSPPPLKWVPISHNGAVRAEVLISAEMAEATTDESANATDEPSATVGIPNSIKPNMRNFVLEVVFAGFRNYTKCNIGNKHRIKVMMGDLLLSSGLSTTRLKNSVNFLMVYATGVVSLPEQLEYWPAIIVTDVTVSGRNAETTVGAALIPNSKRFLQRNLATKCLPKVQFDRASSPGGSLALLVEDGEKSPLLAKNKHTNMMLRFLGGLRSLKKLKRIKRRPSTRLPLNPMDLPVGEDERDFTWWTKFYNSLYVNPNETNSAKHTLIIYTNEIEKQSEFSFLTDWAEPVRMVHGIRYKKNALPKEEVYTTLKLQVKVTQCLCKNNDCGDGPSTLRPLTAALNPKLQARVQAISELTKIVTRVYIVQGLNFRPHDKHSQSDSYVKLQLGTKVASNRASYVPNESNPIFGKCFQLEGTMPRDHILEITAFDRNTMRDEIIGSTQIDLEDRWRTRHRATVGLAKEYSYSGYNKWRDVSTPFEILAEYCSDNDLKEPIIKGNTLEVDGVTFVDNTRIAVDEELQERLALTALHNFDSLPTFGYKLMPEHVETRSLYRNDFPGIEQGKLQLWIELYEGNLNVPPPIDITPKPPKIYELRVIIHNCADVVLDEKNIFGKYMSDIFVKGWCAETSQAQVTDIHYRSLNGEGNFNWRMIFPLKYSDVDGMMVAKRKGGFFDEYEVKQPPVLYLQIWDNDVVSQDDFLGACEINLAHFPQPFDSQKSCTITNQSVYGIKNPFSRSSARIPCNIFTMRRLKGWFPMYGPPKFNAGNKFKDNMKGMTGKIEIELEMLTDAEATSRPVGLGRNPPEALPVPDRPDTSFNPWLNPFKAVTKILYPAMRKHLFILLGIGIVLLMCFGFFYMFPIILMRLG